MSTVAGKRKRSLQPAPHLESLEPRKGRRRWVFVALLGLLLLVGWWAPAMVARTPLRDTILNWCLADLQGHVTSGGASLGWLSPVTAYDVTVSDREGQTVMTVPTLSSDKTLLSLAMQQQDLGRFRFEMPQLKLDLRADGSNVEEVLAEWLKPSDQPSSEGTAIALEFVDGAVTIQDKTSGLQWQIRELKAGLQVPRAAADPLTMNLSGVISQPNGLGSFSATFSEREATSTAGTSASAGQITLSTKQFPLAAIQALLRRSWPNSQIAGELAANLSYQWGPDDAGQYRRSLDGQANARQFVLSAPVLAGDQLRFEQFDLVAKAAEQQNQLRIETLLFNCEAGQLSCRATVPDAAKFFAATNLGTVLQALKPATAEVSGQIDLARLATLIPHALRLRDGMQITAGTLAAQLASRPEQGHMAWQGNVETTRLVALYQGREITWDQPLKMSLAAHESTAGPVVDSVQCSANFLQLEGKGDLNAFQLQGSCDLDRLAAEAGRFVDLHGLQLAGKGALKGNWKRTPEGSFQAGAEAQLAGFEFTPQGGTPWKEQQLTVSGIVAGQLAEQNWVGRIDGANLALASGSDQLAATLKAPINDLRTVTAWPINVQMQGSIATWLARLRPWFQLPVGWQMSGDAELTASASISPTVIDVTQSRVRARSFRLNTPTLHIEDPELTIEGAGKWLSAEQQLQISRVQTTGSVELDVTKAVVNLSNPNSPNVTGDVGLAMDIPTLQKWLSGPAVASDWKWGGNFAGQAKIEQANGKTKAVLQANLENLSATPTRGVAFHEPNIKVNGQAEYDLATDTLRLEQFATQSDLLQLQAAGRVEQVSTAQNLQLSGKLDYDLAKLTRLLQPFIGTNIQLAGRESGSFSLSGPIATPAPAKVPGANAPSKAVAPGQQFTGKAELGWQWANLYGFEIGRGKLTGELADGLIRITPIDMAVSQGRIHLAPQIRIAPGPAELLLPAGPLVEKLQITPEMCSRGLAYIAPVLAGVTQAQGKFSVSLDGGRIPLADPSKGDVSGKLTVHAVDIAPGPMIQELAMLSGHGGVAQLKRESEVSFRMVQGRIYHQGMELEFPDLTIRTHGSVGFDKTLAILAEMPVPPKWIGDNQLGNAIKGQTIQIPLGGTLQNPKLDRQAMNQASAQFIRKAGENVIRNELDKQLEKVLPQGLGPLFQQPR